VRFVGVGKCAVRGGRALEALLGATLADGIALDVSAAEDPDSKIEVHIGTHPLPTDVNEAATKRILEFLSAGSENDLVIMLISGGGSTLLCLPDAPMTCSDEGTLLQSLVARAAPIQDVNMVRKHISRARGGALAEAAYPAEMVSLIISDVPGNNLALIASGPTVRDSSTVADAQAVLEKYGIPASEITFVETPKEEKFFARVTNTLFLSGVDALASMEAEAVRRGYAVSVVDPQYSGEARDLGRAIIKKLRTSAPKTVLLYAGESTVTLDAHAGKGGRNQEMALAVLEDMRDGELVLPFASDGRDNTDHAGAIADETTAVHAREKNISATDYLSAHNSYEFFKTVGDALVTGYTGTNVSDLIIALKQ
jgi:glycerate-2-kinase